MIKSWLFTFALILAPVTIAAIMSEAPCDGDITTVSPPTPGWSTPPPRGTTDVVAMFSESRR